MTGFITRGLLKYTILRVRVIVRVGDRVRVRVRDIVRVRVRGRVRVRVWVNMGPSGILSFRVRGQTLGTWHDSEAIPNPNVIATLMAYQDLPLAITDVCQACDQECVERPSPIANPDPDPEPHEQLDVSKNQSQETV